MLFILVDSEKMQYLDPPFLYFLSFCNYLAANLLVQLYLRYDIQSYNSNRFLTGALLVTSMFEMGAPRWSLMTLTVTPVVGLLTAIRPSLPPDKIIVPANMHIRVQL